jgi:hypothetical protein
MLLLQNLRAGEYNEALTRSLVKFRTDGPPVLIVYEAPQDYWDYRLEQVGR